MTSPDSLPPRIVLSDMPGHLLRRLNQRQFALFAAHMGSLELSPPQFATLAWLHNEGEVDQATLARGIEFDAVTLGGVLARLEAKAWIERRPHPSDRRAKLVRLTRAGTKVLAQALPRVRTSQAAFLGALSDTQRAAWIELNRTLLQDTTACNLQ